MALIATRGIMAAANGWRNIYQVVCNGTTQLLDGTPGAGLQAANAWAISGWWTDNNATPRNRVFLLVANKTGVLATYFFAARYNTLNWGWGWVVDGVTVFAESVPFAGWNPISRQGLKTNHLWTYDGAGLLRWYVDGQLIRTQAQTCPMSALFGATTPADTISANGYFSNGTPTGWVNADLDQFSTWSAAKTYADINEGGAPMNLAGAAGLVDWWDWDNDGDTGSSAANRGGGSNITGYNSPTLEAV